VWILSGDQYRGDLDSECVFVGRPETLGAEENPEGRCLQLKVILDESSPTDGK
jgi:hypothetical protein